MSITWLADEHSALVMILLETIWRWLVSSMRDTWRVQCNEFAPLLHSLGYASQQVTCLTLTIQWLVEDKENSTLMKAETQLISLCCLRVREARQVNQSDQYLAGSEILRILLMVVRFTIIATIRDKSIFQVQQNFRLKKFMQKDEP
jgi:hypothetical protein